MTSGGSQGRMDNMLLRKLGIGLSIIGLFDSIYLAIVKVTDSGFMCGITSCETVNNSSFSYLLGVPVSIWGVAFYLVVLGLIILKKYRLFFIVSLFGLIFAAYLTYIEGFVLHAWCQWCILSAWIVVGLVVVSWRLRSSSK